MRVSFSGRYSRFFSSGVSLALLFGAAALISCDDDTKTTDPTPDVLEVSDVQVPDFPEVPPPDLNEVEPDVVVPCTAGETKCLDTTTMLFCVNGTFEEQMCFGGDVCRADRGSCGPPLCPVPGLPFRCESPEVELVCNPDMVSSTPRECPEGQICVGGRCGVQVCTPGHRRCKSPVEVEQCNESGTGWSVIESCAEATLCGGSGQCTPLCELNEKTASFLGCEYWLLDMDNISHIRGANDPLPPVWGVTVSNGHPTLTAQVSIIGGGNSYTTSVPPRELRVVELPPKTAVHSSGVFSQQALYLQSSIPVSVHQFNPLNDANVASNDASLMLPVNALGKHYVYLSYPLTVPRAQFDAPSQFGGSVEPYIDIIGTEAGTTVTITSPVALPGSASFSAVPANTPTNFTLNKGQLLHILAPSILHVDLSGLVVLADKPVAVLAGNRCASIPHHTEFCDHIQQQLFPVETWGTSYYAAKFQPRGTEDDIWRVVAAQPNTTVYLTPPQGGVAEFVLNSGEVREFRSKEDFKIAADGKIMVGQFMVGSNYPGIPMSIWAYYDPSVMSLVFLPGDGCLFCGLYSATCHQNACLVPCTSNATCTSINSALACGPIGYCGQGLTGIGDPAYALAVPTAQYRSDYIVMTPTGYQENYLSIITPKGRVPMLNGTRITEAPFSGVPTTVNDEMDIYRIRVEPGVHELNSNQAFGVNVYGYAADVSYAYPGGLNLEIIN